MHRILSNEVRILAASLLLLLPGLGASAQTYEWKNVQIVGGGFVPGIVFSEAEPGLVYARTDIGGAYRMDSTTQGRWVPLLDWVGWDEWGYTGVVSLALDPSDADTVYCAVGSYTNGWDPNHGAILKSTDRGATWSVSPLPFFVGGNMAGRGAGERLAVDPNDGNILYFGATGDATEIYGLWRSTDGSATWSEVTSFTAQGDFREDPLDAENNYLNQYQGIFWVLFDGRFASGGVTQSIYVGLATKNGPTIHHSADGGATWAPLAGQPVDFPDNDPEEDMHLMPKKAKLDSTNGILYVAYGHRSGPYEDGKGEVWKYDTGSRVWTEISPVANDGVLFEGDCWFGYNGLTLDRQNPSTLMVTAYSSWWPDTILYRSTDAGATWAQIWEWDRYPNRIFHYTQDIEDAPWLYWNYVPPHGRNAEVSPKLGWMTETLEIDPFDSDHMMYGTGATIYGTTNLTAWDSGGQVAISVMAEGIEETAIQALLSPPVGPHLLSGMYDINGFVHDDVDVVPEAFYDNPGIATTTFDYAELSPTVIWRAGAGVAPDGAPVTGVPSAGYSTDSGASWTEVPNEPDGTTNGGTLAVAADGSRVVWAPEGAGGVFVTTNDGLAWTASSGVPNGVYGPPRVASDRVDPSRFYAWVEGAFYSSTDGGSTFAQTPATGLPDSTVRFHAVPGHPGHLWLAGGTPWGNTYGLFRSTDSGASFTRIAAFEEADSIGFGKAAPGETYPALYTSARLGGIRGFYRSTDEGASWIRINDDAHQYGVGGVPIAGDLRIFGRVYIGTNGRGVIYGDEVYVPADPPDGDPSGLVAGAVDSGRIDLAWTDGSTNESGFGIERSLTGGGGFSQIATVGTNATSYSDTGLAAGTTYYYRVRAFNGAGVSAYTNEASATTDEAGDTLHVGSIVTTVVAVPGGNEPHAEVVIVDSGGLPVAGATVSGTFTTNVYTQSGSGVTGADGTVVIEGSKNRNLSSATFCVDSVTHATLSYDPAANVVTCDSN